MADETLDQSISSSLAKTLPPAVSLTQDNTFQDEAAHDRFFRFQDRELMTEQVFEINQEILAELENTTPAVVALHDCEDFAKQPDDMNVLKDFCILGSQCFGKTPKLRVMKRLNLKPNTKLRIHFMNFKLMPTGHHSSISTKRMLLLHSLMESHNINVGRITRQEIIARTLYIAKISCLKGLAAEAITPGVTNSIAFNILVAYFRPYFNYVNRRDKAMCTLFHELMLASSITFQEFPAEFLIDLTPPCTYTSRRCEPEENVDYRPTQLPPPQTRREEREL
ncbi:hypothetical protein V6N13_088876 [Hibiscus sabdariffa]